MENIFKEELKFHENFQWSQLGDIKKGRGQLGEDMPVLVYRLLQYTMMNVLATEYSAEKADELFRKAGHLAGSEYAKNVLDITVDFNTFVSDLQESLAQLKIGILRMEMFDPDTGEIILTVGEDLDCSGLPVTNENVCVYDEGFISGILESYTGKNYQVKEVNCWASGDRVCRFQGNIEK